MAVETIDDLIDLINQDPTQVRTALELVKRGLNDLPEMDAGEINSDSDVGLVRDNAEGTEKKVRFGTMVGENANEFDVAVDSVADLRASSFPANLDRIWLSGYYGISTAGGGPLFKSSGTDDGGLKFEDGDGNIWQRPYSAVLSAVDFGIQAGDLDSTDALIAISSAAQSGQTIDLNGFTVEQVHKGNNDNPFNSTGTPNQTTYFLFEQKDNITIRNGKIRADVDMSTNSLNIAGFSGCRNVTFDDVELELLATGKPAAGTFTYDTFTRLIQFRHDEGGRDAHGLTIKSNCVLRINHPEGGTLDDGGTKVGRLAGISFFGDYDSDPDIARWMEGLTIEDGVRFDECTARIIWLWVSRESSIGDLIFRDCGTSSAPAHSFIRITHCQPGINIGNITSIKGATSDGFLLISDNDGPYTPTGITTGIFYGEGLESGAVLSLAGSRNCRYGGFSVRDSPNVNIFGTVLLSQTVFDNVSFGPIYAYGINRIGRINTGEPGAFRFDQIHAEGNGSPDDGLVIASSSGEGFIKISNANISGFKNGINADQDAPPIDMDNFDLHGNSFRGMQLSRGACEGSRFRDGVCRDNDDAGMRVPTDSKLYNIEFYNNGTDQALVNSGTIFDGGLVDGGPNTASGSSGIVSDTSNDGCIIKNVTFLNTNSNLAYALDMPGAHWFLHNEFIDTFNTARWTTFAGTEIFGNYPSDSP